MDKSVRRSRVVLAPLALSSWSNSRVTVANKPAHRGEHDISRKAIARGMSECFGCPVCSCAPKCATFAHETTGAACTRHSLRPPGRGANEFAKLGRKHVAREDTYVSTSLRGAKRRSNPLFLFRGPMDCFASLAMRVPPVRCAAWSASGMMRCRPGTQSPQGVRGRRGSRLCGRDTRGAPHRSQSRLSATPGKPRGS
jgi:hypothetical protein